MFGAYMSLDFTILKDDGSPGEVASLTVEQHETLINRARPLTVYPLLSRVGDYYEDAEFKPEEIPALRQEFQTINPSGMEECLPRLIRLCSAAISARKGITVIAD